jgi:hypothetical protein
MVSILPMQVVLGRGNEPNTWPRYGFLQCGHDCVFQPRLLSGAECCSIDNGRSGLGVVFDFGD